MAVLKFRVYLEEDDAVYRDICIKHTQSFAELHYAILKAYEFDTKHQATFYRSNDKWLHVSTGKSSLSHQDLQPLEARPLVFCTR